MANGFHALLNATQTLSAISKNRWPCDGQFESSWGSDSPQGRALLHKALKQVRATTFSVSHCRSGGGFIFLTEQQTKNSTSIGFDVEDLIRLKKSVIQRVSTNQEISKAPDPRLLWSAKEAALKAQIRRTHPARLITDFFIDSWEEYPKVDTQLFRFNGWEKRQLLPFSGLVAVDVERSYAFAIRHHG